MAKTKTKEPAKVSASMLKSFEKEIKSESKEIEKLEKKIEKLSDKIEKTTKTNIELQENIAQFMLHFTDMAENIKKIVEFMKIPGLKEGSFKEVQKEENSEHEEIQESSGLEISKKTDDSDISKKTDTSEIKEQLLMLAKEKRDLTETLRSLEKQFKKDETRERIKKALQKSGGL